MGLSLFAYTQQALEKALYSVMCYGRSRPLNVVEIGTNRKPIFDFLLVSIVTICLSSIVSEI